MSKAEKELTELAELKTAEVSLVDRGANRKKRFPIFKQEESMTPELEEILKAVLETEVDEEAKLSEIIGKAKISDKGLAALKSALRILASYKDELPADAMNTLAAAAGYAAPSEKKETPAEEKDKTDEEESAPEKKSVKKEEEPVEKNENTEAITKAQTEIDDLKKKLQTETDMRLTQEWIKKAEAELSHYPGKSAKDLGTMLKKMADVDPTAANEQFESMKTASVALKESNIFKSAGSGETGSGNADSAEAKIDKLAKGFVEKSVDAKMTYEKAYSVVIKREPELYAQYLKEHTEQGSVGA
jgi:hypothetical protein